MEIIRGSLDDISRPGSRGSSLPLPHTDRICPTTPFSLVVLTKDTADIQIPSGSEETTEDSSARNPGKGHSHIDASEEENEYFLLQRAVEEMKRLDEILSAEIAREKEIGQQGKELQAKLWQEFLCNRPEGHSECAHEALNTRLFLALEASKGTDEEDDFVRVFDTQVPERDGSSQHLEPSKKRPDSLTKSSEFEYEDAGEDQFEGRHCGDSKGMNKQKDFVKKNIELVSGERGEVLLTQAEKRHLAELLREIDEEEEDSTRGADSKETVWAVPVLTGQGYTPEPSDLEQLIDIDSKIRLLIPVEEFHSVQSSYTNLTISQGPGSEDSWKCDGDLKPGEKVLQDIKERRGQERRLQEIQRQLELLGQSQEMTNESPDLTEEQLLNLLDGSELIESWSQDLEMNVLT